jgi:hypothetical protein
MHVTMTEHIQQMHVIKPAAALGNGVANGSTGNKFYVLGERRFTDDPDNKDMGKNQDDYEFVCKTTNNYDNNGKTFYDNLQTKDTKTFQETFGKFGIQSTTLGEKFNASVMEDPNRNTKDKNADDGGATDFFSAPVVNADDGGATDLFSAPDVSEHGRLAAMAESASNVSADANVSRDICGAPDPLISYTQVDNSIAATDFPNQSTYGLPSNTSMSSQQ